MKIFLENFHRETPANFDQEESSNDKNSPTKESVNEKNYFQTKYSDELLQIQTKKLNDLGVKPPSISNDLLQANKTKILTNLTERNAITSILLNEIVRQMSLICVDRSGLLVTLWNSYFRFFEDTIKSMQKIGTHIGEKYYQEITKLKSEFHKKYTKIQSEKDKIAFE